MKEAEIIQGAFEAAVEGLYKVMFNSYIIAAGSKAEEKKADSAFKSGLAVARTVRDRAIALL